MGSDGTIPESYARTVEKKQLTAWASSNTAVPKSSTPSPPRAKIGSSSPRIIDPV